jgi:hypothetical protein
VSDIPVQHDESVVARSPTVSAVRAAIARIPLATTCTQEELTRLAFGSRARIGSQIRYSIEKAERPWLERSIGAIILQGASYRNDPSVAAYLAIRIGASTFFEGVAGAGRRDSFTFYNNGGICGSMIEVPDEVEKPTSLWQRLFRSKQKWKILVGGERCGDVSLQYPVNPKGQLFFRIRDGIQLPISPSYRANVACGGGKPRAPFRGMIAALTGSPSPLQPFGDMIIPLNTPRFLDAQTSPEIERMHFLLNIMFRVCFLRLDFSNSD